jgi:hypothetical protein
VIQNSLERIYEGMVTTLRETVAPDVDDPYVKAQVLAMSELLGNLATRTEWRSADLADSVTRIRSLLTEADRQAPAGQPELAAARRLLAASPPDQSDNDGLVAARTSHLAALGGVQAWLGAAPGFDELRSAVDRFTVEMLDEEMARVRTGMYKRSKG